MRFLKSAAIRTIALLLFFAMIAAIVLYQAGAYDIAFIKRPLPNVAPGTETEGLFPPDTLVTEEGAVTDPPATDGGTGSPNTEPPPPVTDPPSTLPSDTDPPITVPPVTDGETGEPLPPDVLEEILTVGEASLSGYSLSQSIFGSGSILARLAYDFGSSADTFSLRTEKITRTEFYLKASGLIGTRKVTETVDKPAVSLYFGLILIDNGKSLDIYNQSGKCLVKGFTGTMVGALSVNGKPVVKKSSKYYEIDSEKGLSKAISKNKIDYKALTFDHPADYGQNLYSALIPYWDYVDVYVEVTLPPETTVPETTVPETTVPETTVPETTVPETTGPETTVPETTVPETTVPETTVPETTVPETTVPETTVPETTVPETTVPETTVPETTVPETTVPETTVPETTVPETTVPETTVPETTVPETTVPETTVPETTETETTVAVDSVTESLSSADYLAALPEGVIEKNGKYYRVEQKVMWGYKNNYGQVLIRPQYASAYAFGADGLACVTDFDGNVFYINEKGKEILSIRNNVTIRPDEMSGTKIRQFFFEPVTKGVESLGLYYFDHGYTMIRYCWTSNFNKKDLYLNEYRLYDTKGNPFEIPGGYTLVNYSDGILLLEKDGLYGYMDTERSWIRPAVYTEASPYIQGIAVVKEEDGRWGVLDREGNAVLPFIFDYVSKPSGGKVAAYSAERGWEIYCVMEK